MSASRTRAASKFDKELRCSQSVGQSTHPKRCSLDLAKRRWYGQYRTLRLSQLTS
jgi:hypothetical protein